MALERFLEWHDLGLKVTTVTICLQKIPRYMATAPQKNPNPVVRRINRLIMPLCIHTAVKGVEPSLLVQSMSLSACAHTGGCQLDQTDDQPERNPTLIEIPLQTD